MVFLKFLHFKKSSNMAEILPKKIEKNLCSNCAQPFLLDGTSETRNPTFGYLEPSLNIRSISLIVKARRV